MQKCRLKPEKRLSDDICPDGISNIFLPARDVAVGRDIQPVPVGEVAAVQINNPPDNGFSGSILGILSSAWVIGMIVPEINLPCLLVIILKIGAMPLMPEVLIAP